MKSRKHLGGGCWPGPAAVLCVQTHKRTPIQPPTDCSHVLAPLEALKLVERVKGIEPSLSAWEPSIQFLQQCTKGRALLYSVLKKKRREDPLFVVVKCCESN
jgi:hypothetical protein